MDERVFYRGKINMSPLRFFQKKTLFFLLYKKKQSIERKHPKLKELLKVNQTFQNITDFFGQTK